MRDRTRVPLRFASLFETLSLMEGDGERSELLSGFDLAQELAVVASRLPLGWAVVMEPSGQLCIEPPPSPSIGVRWYPPLRDASSSPA